MNAVAVRRMALVWWVRNINKSNAERAARWKAIVNRNGGML